MAIRFNRENKVFVLDTKTSSYVMKIYDGGYLLNLYYGRKIVGDNVEDFDIRAKNASFSPAAADVGEGDFAPDSAPIEYGCDGAGDFRVSAIKIRNCSGDSVTDLRYLSHEIIDGKPEIKDMPSTYVNGGEKATTLLINMQDAVTGVQVTLKYTVFENHGVMTKSVSVKNCSKNAVYIERAMSLCKIHSVYSSR